MYSMSIRWGGQESVRNVTGTFPGLVRQARAWAARLGMPEYMCISREDGSWALYANGDQKVYTDRRCPLPLP